VFEFLENLDRDIQQTLLKQLRDLWTHTSTAIEGNTLSLGDTKFILDEGLTVSGKPIKDHQEVIGHAKAIELVYSLIGREITENDLFALHKAIQTEIVTDIYKPHGAWKVEPNGTYAVDDEGRQIFIEYARPSEVPALMQEIITFINDASKSTLTIEQAPAVYAKIHMGIAHTHPFWDGNGRIARLVANIPLLNSGLPPIVIPNEQKRGYIETLARYQREVGEITSKTGAWPQVSKLSEFTNFCAKSYEATKQLVEQAQKQQHSRNM
jgi:Fic family protein